GQRPCADRASAAALRVPLDRVLPRRPVGRDADSLADVQAVLGRGPFLDDDLPRPGRPLALDELHRVELRVARIEAEAEGRCATLPADRLAVLADQLDEVGRAVEVDDPAGRRPDVR